MADAPLTPELLAAWQRLDSWWNNWAGHLKHDPEVERAEWDEWQGMRRAMAATPSPPVAAVPATPDTAPMYKALRDAYVVLCGYNANPAWKSFASEQAERQIDAILHAVPDAAQPQPQPAQPLTGAAPLSDEQIAIRAACSQIIKSLADIVTTPIADDQPFAETVRREPIMQRVQEIKNQVDAIYKALPHPMMQAAPSTPTPEVAP